MPDASPPVSLFTGIPLAGRRFADLAPRPGARLAAALAAGAVAADGVDLARAPLAAAVEAAFAAGPLDPHLEDSLPRIRDLLLIETTPLDADWYRNYVERVEPELPHWALVGFTREDFSRAVSGGATAAPPRALLAFSREIEPAAVCAVDRCEKLPVDHPDLRLIDVAKSPRASCVWGEYGPSQHLFARLRDELSAIPSATPALLVAPLRSAARALRALYGTAPHPDAHFGADRYWLAFLTGLTEYIAARAVAPANTYLIYLRSLSARGGYDPGMVYELEDAMRAAQRLEERFAAFVQVLCERALRRPLLFYNPLSLAALERQGYELTPAHVNEHVEFVGHGDHRIQCIDGNHRLAALWLGGAARCPVLPVWTNIFGLDPARYALFEAPARQAALLAPLLAGTVLTLATAPPAAAA